MTDGYPTPPRKNKLLVYAVLGILCLAIIVAITVLVVLINSSNGEESLDLVEVRENTKTLQIYATLDEEMTAGELEKAAKAIDSDAEITFYDNGTGKIEIPGENDMILFDHQSGIFEGLESPIDDSDYEPINNVETIDEEESDDDDDLYDEDIMETDGITDDELIVDYYPSAVTYQPGDIVREIRYSYPIMDNAYSISYSSEEKAYIVFNLMYEFAFPTKDEAIKAYLAPEVIEENSTGA